MKAFNGSAAPPSPAASTPATSASSTPPWPSCYLVHLHPSELAAHLHRPSLILPRPSSASSSSSSSASSAFSPSSPPPPSSPLSRSNPSSLSTLSTPTGSPVSAGPSFASPLWSSTTNAAPRPWEGRVFSAQWKAVPVSILLVHAFTVWESVQLVLTSERVQMESLYARRVVLSLRFDELRRCTRDLSPSKLRKGKRARVLIANADRQWTLDLFEEAEAIAFYDLLTRALATSTAGRRLRQGSSSDLPEMARQQSAARDDEPLLLRTGELSGALSEAEAADAADTAGVDVDPSGEHSRAVAALHQRILSHVSDAVRMRVEEGDPLSTLLQLLLAVSPFEAEPFDAELLDYRRPLSFSATFPSSLSPPSTSASTSALRCADDPCDLPAVAGSIFCVRHCWRDEVTNAGALDDADEDALTELRFSFPAANLLAAQLLHAELELRDALTLVLDEYYHPLLQQPVGAEADQAALSKEELRAAFAPFVRCHALSVSLARDLQRLSTHSALLPFLCRTLLQHLPDIQAVYGASFRFADSIDCLRSRTDGRGASAHDGVPLRQWREQRQAEQRQAELAQADVLGLMGLAGVHMRGYLRLLKAIEAQLPAKEKTAASDDTALAPPRLRRLHRELDDCWQELMAVHRANEAAQRRETEGRRMEELSERLTSPFALVAEGRRLIREDEVRLQGAEDGHLLLFNDLLVFALPEGPKRTAATLHMRRSSLLRDGSGTSLGRWVVVLCWPTSEVQATWWPKQADAADGNRRSVTLHTATGQFDVHFLDVAVNSDGDHRLRAGETRDRWCAAWEERTRAPVREANAAAVLAAAQQCLDERRLSSVDFVQGVQPGMRRLCEEALLDLVRPVSPPSLPPSLLVVEDLPSSSVWAALVMVAVTGMRVRGRATAHTAGLQALAVIALLVDASVRSLCSGGDTCPAPEKSRRGGSYGGAAEAEASAHALVVRALAPLLSPLSRRAEVAEELLVVLFVLWCNRTSAIACVLLPTWSCPTALHLLPCQAACNDALSACGGDAECGHLLPVLLHVAASTSLKSRAWLWQRLSDVSCQEPRGALALLRPTWTSWPSLVLASMRGVRRPHRSRASKYSQRVWRFLAQMVDALLLEGLLWYPASAFARQWEGLRRAVEWEWEQASSHGHLVLQHLLACTLRRVQHHPRFQPLLKPSTQSSSAPTRLSDGYKGDGKRLQAGSERAAQTRLAGCLDVLFYKVLSFVVTAGSRFPISPLSTARRPSNSSQGPSPAYWLHRTRDAPEESKSPSAGARPAVPPPWRLQSPRPSLSRPTSQPTTPVGTPRAHRRRPSEAVLPNFPALRVDDEEGRAEQRTGGVRGADVVDLHALLEGLTRQRAALRLRWHCTRGDDGAVVAFHLSDGPLLAQLQSTFAAHPALHPVSDLWTKVVSDVEQLRWNRRAMAEGEWREVEERHLCALLLANSAEQRRQADADVQTDIRGLAGKRLPDWFGDMPRLNFPTTAAAQTQTASTQTRT